MPHKILGAVVTLAAVALTSCSDGGSTGKDETDAQTTLSGTVAAPDCLDYDIENSQVILRNEAEEIIGTAQTGTRLVPEPSAPCVVAFEIANVPQARFYTLEIGTHTGPAWSQAQLESQNYETDLSLGDVVVPGPVTTETVCDSISALNDSLHDNHVLDTRRLWDDAIRQSEAVAQDFGTTKYIEGEEMIGRLSYDFADAHPPMLWSRWFTIRQLNRAGDHINEAARALTDELDCDGYWDDVSYVSARIHHRGTVDLKVFPAQRAEPSVQRGRCRDDNDTERHDSQDEAGSLG